jgi:hypothetical protein
MVYFRLDAWGPMLVANLVFFGVLVLIQPLLPKYDPNRKIPMYGSRFNPTQDEYVFTGPTTPEAREDRPTHTTAPA